MKLRSLLVLIIAVAIGGVAYYFSINSKDGLLSSNSYLIPDFSGKLNEVTGLTILEAGDTLLTSISKSRQGWVVDNRDGYEANFPVVHEVFNYLAEAKLIESKTSNPEKYSKLGVENVADSNAQGVQFSIKGLSTPVEIIAGNNGSTGKNSQYIRRVDEKQSWLINKKLNLKRDVTEWLRKDILNIPPERVKSVQIKHTDGSVITVENKGTEEYEFSLLNPLPEGKQISESEIYQVANALSSLQLRDVASLEKLDVEAVQPIITTFMTYDGITITAKSFTIEEQTYSMLDIEFNAENIEANSNKLKDESDPAVNSDPNAAEEFVNTVAPRLKGWAFVLPTITADALVKRLENFFLAEDA